MSTLNKVLIMGYLGQPPIFRTTKGGGFVATFKVATNETYLTKNKEKKIKTEWHSIVVWGKLSENCNKYLTKGSLVLLEGRLETVSWENDRGMMQYRTQIVASAIHFLGPVKEKKTSKQEEEQTLIEEEIPY